MQGAISQVGKHWGLGLLMAVSLVLQPLMAGAAPLMVEKNLFSPDRRPDEADGAEVAAGEKELPRGHIQVDGIFIAGKMKKAILRVNPRLMKDEEKKGPFVTVVEGQRLGDFRIASIEPRKDRTGPFVRVIYQGAEYEVPLFAQGKIEPPPAPVPAGPSVAPAGDQQPDQTGEAGAQREQGPEDSASGAETRTPGRQAPSRSASQGNASASASATASSAPSPASPAAPGTVQPGSPPPTPDSTSQGQPGDASTQEQASGESQGLVPPGVNLFDQMKKAIEDARRKGLIK